MRDKEMKEMRRNGDGGDAESHTPIFLDSNKKGA